MIVHSEKSDHSTLQFKYNCCTEKNTHTLPPKKLYHKADYSIIRSKLSTIDWELLLTEEDINKNWDIFLNTVKSIEEEYIPTYKNRNAKKIKHKYPLDSKTREAIKYKKKLSRK